MALQLSHRSKIYNHLIWFSVFFAISGMVQSCEILQYHKRADKVKLFFPWDFLKSLKAEIDTIGSGSGIKIIEMLASQNKSQLLQIADGYNDCYRRDLIADVKDKLHGKLEQIAVALLTPRTKYYINLIHDAMVGIESDSCALIDILCTVDKKSLQQICFEYQQMYRSRLTTDVDKYTIGKLNRLLSAILRWSRNENDEVDKKLAKSDAQKLYSGPDMFSTDRLLIENILVTGSFSRIRQAVYRYHRDYNEYFESKINKIYGGDVGRALITIVRWSKGWESFFAERLHYSLNFVDTDNHSLIRILVSNIDDMTPIKEAYRNRYHISLERAIRNKLSGPYADALILLINKGVWKVKSIKEETEEETVEETMEETVEETVENISEGIIFSGKKKFNWCFDWC